MITLFYAGLLGVLHVILAENVLKTYVRRTLGRIDDETVQKAQRVHGNFTEYVPHALILIALLEINGAPAPAIHALGGLLLLARLLHVWGMYMKRVINPARTTGVQMTAFVILAAGVGGIVMFVARAVAR